MAGRTLDAGLHLLDRQILDCDGRMAGKVDDLELTAVDGDPDGPPMVTALLTGPAASAPRLGRRLGGALRALLRLVRGDDGTTPTRIDFGVVKRVDVEVELTVSRRDLENDRVERWFRDHVIGRIPGANRASE